MSHKKKEQKEHWKGYSRTIFMPLLAVALTTINSFFWVVHLMGTSTSLGETNLLASIASEHTSNSSFRISPSSNTATNNGLLNHELIRSKLLAEAPWAESHGADHHTYKGAGLLFTVSHTHFNVLLLSCWEVAEALYRGCSNKRNVIWS